ncbi:hypothetical protein [Sorangium sp. So ce1335]|uniref:hypothetical protein n=1 Tax=Sorangium sp. So ce1335 TaxID=3133335 RepID=UPI003F63D77C
MASSWVAASIFHNNVSAPGVGVPSAARGGCSPWTSVTSLRSRFDHTVQVLIA